MNYSIILTVIVSTVLVLDEMVCELMTSPIGAASPLVGEVPALLSFANCGGGGGVALKFIAEAGDV